MRLLSRPEPRPCAATSSSASFYQAARAVADAPGCEVFIDKSWAEHIYVCSRAGLLAIRTRGAAGPRCGRPARLADFSGREWFKAQSKSSIVVTDSGWRHLM